MFEGKFLPIVKLTKKAHMLLERSGDCMCNSPIRSASVLVYHFSRSGCSGYYASQALPSHTTGTLLCANNGVKIKKRFTGANITQKASAFGEEQQQQSVPQRVRLL